MPTSGDDPFDRVGKALSGGDANPVRRRADDGEFVSPVPSDAPEPMRQHGKHGQASTVWTYRNAAGEALFLVCRFDLADGHKEVLPQTLWRRAGRLEWRWKAPPAPRALYGLQALSSNPAAPVLIVEGEKAADAAGERFPGFAAVTWQGGSEASGKADWSPLAGRTVAIWPDADEAGAKAGREVAKRLGANGVRVAIVALPADLPPKWDLADPWPRGMPAEAAGQLLAAAIAVAEPAGVEWPMSIRMEPEAGLFYDEPRDGNLVPHWLCAPFEIMGEARAPDGLGWSVVLRFLDRDQKARTVPISRASLASGGGEARSTLADSGLVFDTARGKMDRLSSALMRVRTPNRITLVSATGWVGDRFILPGRAIGPAGGEPVLFTGEAPSLNYRAGGSLDAWRAEVAGKAAGNSALIFALSAALAAPMLRVVGGEGGGFHFRGHSSTGKSTLLIAAGSVWGGSGGEHGFGHTWRATANALESLALAHNDTLLCLDEFAQVDPSEAGVAAYALANGQGKARLKADGNLRRRAEWLLLFLSSGELSLADHMASSPKGGRPAAGQELRLVDVPAEAGAGMGIWESLHDATGPAQLSESVKSASRRHYGHAGPMFLERLTASRTEAVALARDMVAGFLKTAEQNGDSGQVHRVGRRFALVGAAGELAIAWGVVPWAPGSAASAALALYRRWAEAFGRDTPREERDVLRRLRDVIQSERSAFVPAGDDDMGEQSSPSERGRDGEARQMKTHGFRHVRGSEVRYMFHSTGWQYVFRGLDLADAARIVDSSGFLETDGDKRRLQKSVKIRGEKHRVYCVLSSILGEPLGD